MSYTCANILTLLTRLGVSERPQLAPFASLNDRSHRSLPANAARAGALWDAAQSGSHRRGPRKRAEKRGASLFSRLRSIFIRLPQASGEGQAFSLPGRRPSPNSIRRRRGESTPRDRRDEGNGTTATNERERTTDFWRTDGGGAREAGRTLPGDAAIQGREDSSRIRAALRAVRARRRSP